MGGRIARQPKLFREKTTKKSEITMRKRRALLLEVCCVGVIV